MRAVLTCILALCLTACSGASTRPDLPHTVTVPRAVNVVRQVYVQVPAELTDPLPIASGPLAQCPMVAADRRAQLERANADRAAVRALSGTEVKP